MLKSRSEIKNICKRRIIKLLLLLFFTSCLQVPKTKVNIENPECSKFKYVMEEIEWTSEDLSNGKKGEFPYIYDDIQKKYILSRVNSNRSSQNSKPTKIKLKLKLERTYNSSLILGVISTLTLSIIPNWADIKYSLSGSVINENGAEEILQTASQRSTIYYFFPLFLITDIVDFDKGLPEYPDRIKRELIDSFLEANLKICNLDDSNY